MPMTVQYADDGSVGRRSGGDEEWVGLWRSQILVSRNLTRLEEEAK